MDTTFIILFSQFLNYISVILMFSFHTMYVYSLNFKRNVKIRMVYLFIYRFYMQKSVTKNCDISGNCFFSPTLIIITTVINIISNESITYHIFFIIIYLFFLLFIYFIFIFYSIFLSVFFLVFVLVYMQRPMAILCYLLNEALQ